MNAGCRVERLSFDRLTAKSNPRVGRLTDQEVRMMKRLIHTAWAVAVVAVPVACWAQADSSLTRAQVQAELVQLQQSGYNPANAATVDFPANMQSSDASAAGQGGYGPSTSGSSQMGHPASTSSGMKPVFFGGS
jgi:hypothetical protein